MEKDTPMITITKREAVNNFAPIIARRCKMRLAMFKTTAKIFQVGRGI